MLTRAVERGKKKPPGIGRQSEEIANDGANARWPGQFCICRHAGKWDERLIGIGHGREWVVGPP